MELIKNVIRGNSNFRSIADQKKILKFGEGTALRMFLATNAVRSQERMLTRA